uniref:C2H2-type domain-containing protein n=1 Tax=Oryza brachyantha TaxID=4533 RepID=J3LIK2_ORYBR
MQADHQVADVVDRERGLALVADMSVEDKQQQLAAAVVKRKRTKRPRHHAAPAVHECSICGAEFGSGQALGGHMRRHRPLHAPPERAVTTATTADTKKDGSTSINLELDLNLPAPSDEESVSPPPPPPVLLALGGQFNDGKKPILLTSSAALVGCHY